MAYEIPASFMAQFEINLCPECNLEHAAVRTCDEAREFQKTLDTINTKLDHADENQAMSQYTDEDVDVYLAQGREYDKKQEN